MDLVLFCFSALVALGGFATAPSLAPTQSAAGCRAFSPLRPPVERCAKSASRDATGAEAAVTREPRVGRPEHRCSATSAVG